MRHLGNDTLDGQAGDDTMRGGDGHDTYVVDSHGDVIEESPGAGTDRVLVNFTDPNLPQVYTLPDNIENANINVSMYGGELHGNAANNTLIDTSVLLATLYGEDGDDILHASTAPAATASQTLHGGNGNDIIYVHGSDYAYGDAGNDRFISVEGGSWLFGGTGNDVYIVSTDQDAIVENLAEGIDSVQSSVNYTLSPNVENLTLTTSAYYTYGTGNELNNILTGATANNSLYGMSGDDTLIGGGGDDDVYGGDGNDLIKVGDDSLSPAWVGVQWLTGNEGQDTFWFGKSYSGDHAGWYVNHDYAIIIDFTSGEDHIRLPVDASSALPSTMQTVMMSYVDMLPSSSSAWPAVLNAAATTGSASNPSLTLIRAYDSNYGPTYLVLDRSDSATFTSNDVAICLAGDIDLQMSDLILQAV